MKSIGVWSLKLLDKNGYRSNVAIILSDGKGRVLLAKRIGQASWQFPQGGIDSNEICLLYTSPSPRDTEVSRMPSSA